VEYADKSVDASHKMIASTTCAAALHQAGKIEEAEKLFIEAEGLQKEGQPEYPRLYSVRGFKYCDLILEKRDYKEVLKRAEETLEWAEKYLALLDIALGNLSFGRAHLYKTLKEGGDYSKSERYLNEAVDGLRKASDQAFITCGLLAHAELYRIKGVFSKAERDITKAMTIATRGEMKLYQADCHLEYARLHLAEGDKAKAHGHWSTAKTMINEMGYHRRDKDIEEIEKLLDRQ